MNQIYLDHTNSDEKLKGALKGDVPREMTAEMLDVVFG